MSWKKFILGDKMPDKDDPKYQKQYEREVSSGRKFAEKLHLDFPRSAAFCEPLPYDVPLYRLWFGRYLPLSEYL